MKKTLMSRKFRAMLFCGTLIRAAAILMFTADSIIAGRMFGEDALSGISLVSPLFSFAVFMSMIFSTGIPILYGKAMGRFQKEEADRYFGFGLSVSVIAGVITFVSGLLFGNLYLAFFNVPESVLSHARNYLFWMNFVFLVMPLQTYISDMVYEDGDDILSTSSDIVSTMVNIPLSIVLCMKLGTAGLSLGTFITTAIGTLIPAFHFLKKKNSLKLGLYFSLNVLAQTVRYSMVDACSYLFLALYAIILEKFVVIRFGPDMLVVASMIVTLNELSIIFDGVGDAMSPILSVYLGEGVFQGLKGIFSLARRASNVEGITVSVLVLIFAPLVPDILGITDPECVLLCIHAARIICLGYVFTSLMFLLSSYYLLLDKFRLSIIICMLRDFIAPLLLAITLGTFFGMYGMFIGMALAPFLGVAVTVLFIQKKYGRDEYPLLIPEQEKISMKLYDLVLGREEIIRLCDEIEETLKAHGYEKKLILKTRLMVEELFMLIYEINGGQTVLSECLLDMRGDHIELTEMDNGKAFDLTDEDMPMNSLRAYLITRMTSTYVRKKKFLPTLSENRNTFSIYA